MNNLFLCDVGHTCVFPVKIELGLGDMAEIKKQADAVKIPFSWLEKNKKFFITISHATWVSSEVSNFSDSKKNSIPDLLWLTEKIDRAMMDHNLFGII